MVRNGKRLTPEPHLANKKLASSKKLTLSFSFLYFRQIENFGIGGEESTWFISLIDRLKDMCSKDNSILRDHFERSTYRLHTVNWSQTNIPIQRADLTWLPDNYRNNDEEFPMWQFAISTGKGRVIGFFNEQNTVFNIVLLDPKHNMQPSADFHYKVDRTEIGCSEITKMRCKVAELIATNPETEEKWKSLSKDSDNEYIALDRELALCLHSLLKEGSLQQELEKFLFDKLK